MKIAYCSASILPSTRANSVHVMKMCQSFAKNGHDVTLFYSSSQDYKNINLFAYYGVDSIFNLKSNGCRKFKRCFSLYNGLVVSKSIKFKSVDIVYARCPHSAFFVGLIKNVPFIYEAHDFPKRRMRFLLERLLFNLPAFQRLVVISNSLREDYLLSFPCLKEKDVVVAHDGADIYENFIADSDFLRSDASGQFKVGYVGSLSAGRGIEMIISLAKLRPQVEFHIVGGINEEILNLAKCSPSNIIFHGFVDPAKVFSYLRSFDVLLMPYEQGINTVKYMSPMKMFEYMASGRAIISSNIPVLREVLTSGYNALLVDFNDLNSWLKSIDILLSNTALRCMIARNAFNEISSKYTWVNRSQYVLADIHC